MVEGEHEHTTNLVSTLNVAFPLCIKSLQARSFTLALFIFTRNNSALWRTPPLPHSPAVHTQSHMNRKRLLLRTSLRIHSRWARIADKDVLSTPEGRLVFAVLKLAVDELTQADGHFYLACSAAEFLKSDSFDYLCGPLRANPTVARLILDAETINTAALLGHPIRSYTEFPIVIRKQRGVL